MSIAIVMTKYYNKHTVFSYKCAILEAAVQCGVEVVDAPSYETDLIYKIQMFKNVLGNCIHLIKKLSI